MKTDHLIALLAQGETDAISTTPRAMFLIPLLSSTTLSLLLMLVVLGVREDTAAAIRLPMFWIKLAFPLTLAITALVILRRLAYPGRATGHAPLMLILPCAFIWVMAVLNLLQAPAGGRWPMLMGQTWMSCLIMISVLAAPVMVAGFLILRQLAPTRLLRAGASAGLLGGATGATVYALHCPELAAAFLAIWSGLGILLPTLAGALLGPRLLRW